MSNQVKLCHQRYGKANVRFLRVNRESPRHQVKEIRARMLLEGDFEKSYTEGDNSTIVATDTQKNTLLVLSKKYPVEPIEQWSLLVAKDLMSRHAHVSTVHLKCEEFPWDRITVEGKEHNHAFQRSVSGVRVSNLKISKSGKPVLIGGFRDLEVMKSTQSGFENFLRDDYTSLPETKDRVFCTKMKCKYTFNRLDGVNFTQVYEKVKQIALDTFAGNPVEGTYSPSVQQTLYMAGERALKEIPELETIFFSLPNVHFYLVDFKNWKTNLDNKNEVLQTYDGPHGLIEAKIVRQSKSKL